VLSFSHHLDGIAIFLCHPFQGVCVDVEPGKRVGKGIISSSFADCPIRWRVFISEDKITHFHGKNMKKASKSDL